jgi:hypothetical protein
VLKHLRDNAKEIKKYIPSAKRNTINHQKAQKNKLGEGSKGIKEKNSKA